MSSCSTQCCAATAVSDAVGFRTAYDMLVESHDFGNTGCEPAVSKGDEDQNPAGTPVTQAPTSKPPNTQDIMKMLLGTK